MYLIKKFKPLINKNIRGTGLGGDEPTEHEVLIEKIINIYEDTNQKTDEAISEASQKEKSEKEASLDVRQTAMERMS